MKLFSTMTVMSMLRRQAWMKWFPPIAVASPSPLTTITRLSGPAAFRPPAGGGGRPEPGAPGDVVLGDLQRFDRPQERLEDDPVGAAGAPDVGQLPAPDILIVIEGHLPNLLHFFQALDGGDRVAVHPVDPLHPAPALRAALHLVDDLPEGELRADDRLPAVGGG